jgi:hypothetical protein
MHILTEGGLAEPAMAREALWRNRFNFDDFEDVLGYCIWQADKIAELEQALSEARQEAGWHDITSPSGE